MAPLSFAASLLDAARVDKEIVRLDCFAVKGNKTAESQQFAACFEDVHVKVGQEFAELELKLRSCVSKKGIVVAPVGLRPNSQLRQAATFFRPCSSNMCGQGDCSGAVIMPEFPRFETSVAPGRSFEAALGCG